MSRLSFVVNSLALLSRCLHLLFLLSQAGLEFMELSVGLVALLARTGLGASLLIPDLRLEACNGVVQAGQRFIDGLFLALPTAVSTNKPRNSMGPYPELTVLSLAIFDPFADLVLPGYEGVDIAERIEFLF